MEIDSRRRLALAALGGVAALCGGCSVLGAVNALVPADTYKRTAGAAYGEHPRQRLDVYAPAAAGSAAPLVLFFYGGNWNAGERGDYRFAGEALASRGFVAVIPDYRLYPEVRFPDFLRDCAAAVRWSVDNAARHGADPKCVFLMGHSAGAYNAAMLALDPQYLEAARADRSCVRGWIGLAGPYDFLPLTGAISRAVFGYPDTSITTQPIHFASSDDPPALLVTGSDDRTVNPANTARLGARLRAKEVAVTERVYAGINHYQLVGALAAPLRRLAPVLEDVTAFVRDRASDRLIRPSAPQPGSPFPTSRSRF